MNDIQTKAFILHKEGDWRLCEDSFALSLPNGRFAVADGLSNSYHPEYIAQLLCHKFAAGAIDMDDWDRNFPSLLLNEIHPLWKEKVDEYESTLSGRKLSHAQIRREALPAGASTFLGIEVDREHALVRCVYLGDSSLFLISDNEWKVFCSNNAGSPCETDVVYDNNPSCVTADGIMYGKWTRVEFPLQKGYLVLATDGCAEWIQTEFQEGNAPVQQLWELEDHDAFVELVTSARARQKMEDDIAVIILKVDELPFDRYEPLWIDSFSPLTSFIDLESMADDSKENDGVESEDMEDVHSDEVVDLTSDESEDKVEDGSEAQSAEEHDAESVEESAEESEDAGTADDDEEEEEVDEFTLWKYFRRFFQRKR